MKRYPCFLFLILLSISSCLKEDTDNNSKDFRLGFSQDTLTFDTVFQTIGSATRSMRIYNSSSGTVNVSSVRLLKGSQSSFRFNIDGVAGNNVQNLKILASDSAWLFVEVRIDPNVNTLIVQDSLELTVNGQKQYILLRAIGQNAYFHKGEIISSNTVWKNDKPHVIFYKMVTSNSIVPGVVVQKGATLTIPAGTKLYFDNSSGIIVDGTLQCLGAKDQIIQMGGLRLEKEYNHSSGQWIGILIYRGSVNNVLDYTELDESTFGLWMGFQDQIDYTSMTNATRPKIKITNSVIKNAQYWALRSFNSEIIAQNSLFYTSTQYLAQLWLGGNFTIENCTFYNSQSQDNKGVFLMTNRFNDAASGKLYTNGLDAVIDNSIFYGNADEHILLDLENSVPANYTIANCLYRSNSNFTNSKMSNCILNKDPFFVSTTIDKEIFKLKPNSPCIDMGWNNQLTIDITGNNRSGLIDIGAYEYQP